MASWLFGLKSHRNTSTFSKSLKLELMYLVINKSGQLRNLYVCIIFLIRFEVSQLTPNLYSIVAKFFLFVLFCSIFVVVVLVVCQSKSHQLRLFFFLR